MAFAFNIIGGSLFCLFAFISYINDKIWLALILLVSATIAALSLVGSFRRTNTVLYRNISSANYLLVCFALIASGGVNGTGIYWAYPLMAISIAIVQSPWAIKLSLCYLLIVSVLLIMSPQWEVIQTYNHDQSYRHIASMFSLQIVLILLVFTHEYYQRKLKREAVTDALTQVFNRSVLQVDLFKEKREKTKIASLMLLDIDNFKSINDIHGHDIGDLALQKVAHIIKDNSRESDYVIRWGGEEFLVCLTNAALEDSIKKAEHIRKKIETSELKVGNEILSLTVSIGVTTIDKHSFEDAIKIADNNLLHSKKTGKNKVTAS